MWQMYVNLDTMFHTKARQMDYKAGKGQVDPHIWRQLNVRCYCYTTQGLKG